MAPRRNNTNPDTGTLVDVQNLLGLGQHSDHDQGFETSSSSPNSLSGGSIMSSFSSSGHQYSHSNNNHHQMMHQGHHDNYVQCCVPNGDCLKSNSVVFSLINLTDLSECQRVICNNENCSAGQYMHRECFEAWEQQVLNSLKSIGRARSWSDRQRAQNLWTKKGYDLVFKACGCKCGRGHLKKDLDWVVPTSSSIFGGIDEEATKKKKKRNRNNQKPSLGSSAANHPGAYHPNSQLNNNSVPVSGNNGVNCALTNGSNSINHGSVEQQQHQLRGRAGSLSSSNGTTSPPVSAGSSELSISPIQNHNNNSGGSSSGGKKLMSAGYHQQLMSHSQVNNSHQPLQVMLTPQQQHQQQNKTKVEIYSERVRTTSGCNGIFSRRLDFSSFNVLPSTRLNSYQVKMEDEGNHGNDETRLFILSSLAQNQKSRVACILCEEPMLVFDRYPLVDGTFFLSPRQHSPGCIEVKYEGRNQFLTAVCMGCLDGKSPERAIFCRFCGETWKGGSLVIGTMYSYDIFAAMPCCLDRLKCNACMKLLIHPQQRMNFFSDYNHTVSCPFCSTQDHHFVKPLSLCYTKQRFPKQLQWP